jgi:hypothetical protein
MGTIGEAKVKVGRGETKTELLWALDGLVGNGNNNSSKRP